MNLLKSAISLILFLALVSCNDDVFVDRPDSIGDDTVVMLDSNGSSVDMGYSTKNLKGITLSHDGDCPISVYAPDGKLIAETTAGSYDVTGPCQLAMVNDFVSVWVSFDRQGIVSAYADNNAYDHNFTVELTFDYGKNQRKAYFVVEPGPRYRLTDIKYDFGAVTREPASRQIKLPVVNNRSDQEMPISFVLSSYIPDYFRFTFDADYAAMLESELPDVAPVPTLNAAGVVGLYGRGAMFVNSEIQTADSDLSGEIHAVVPPMSRLIITVEVSYTTLTVPFVAEVVNENGRFTRFEGIVHSSVARDYKEDIKEEKL